MTSILRLLICTVFLIPLRVQAANSDDLPKCLHPVDTIQVQAPNVIAIHDVDRNGLFVSERKLVSIDSLDRIVTLGGGSKFLSLDFLDDHRVLWQLSNSLFGDLSIVRESVNSYPTALAVRGDYVLYYEYSFETDRQTPWAILDTRNGQIEAFQPVYLRENNPWQYPGVYSNGMTRVILGIPSPRVLDVLSQTETIFEKTSLETIEWSPKDNFISGETINNTIAIFDAANGYLIRELNVPFFDGYKLGTHEWSNNEKFIAVTLVSSNIPMVHPDHVVVIYDVESGTWLEACFQKDFDTSQIELPSGVIHWSHDDKYIWWLEPDSNRGDAYELLVIDTDTVDYGRAVTNVGRYTFIGWNEE